MLGCANESRDLGTCKPMPHSIKMYGKVFLQTVYFESRSETEIRSRMSGAYEITSL